MNYKEMKIEKSYISYGDNNIADSFISPLLKITKTYKRSVGFFTSGVFETISDGILFLARNRGKIRLIASPRLNDEDIMAIDLGYEKREAVVSNIFSKDFIEELEKLDTPKLKMLVELIANNVLDIKIAITPNTGIYHDKLGILEDFEGNKVVFFGSPNSSQSGYKDNYEKIRVVKGWEGSNCEIIVDEENEFDSLWNGKNKFVDVFDYREIAKEKIISIVSNRNNKKNGAKEINLRDYQEEAIIAWKNNKYKGFFVMATGTGKTWTAIFAAKELLQNEHAMIVICAPYKHLVKQWEEDVRIVFPDAKIILVSSENHNWEIQISQEIIKKQYDNNNQIIIITTIASFNMERFKNTLNKSSEEKLLIVDEAHRFTQQSDEIKAQYKYMLGLSATPYSGTNSQKGKLLMDFFGGEVFNLPIEVALERNYLVPYNYNPIFVNATEDEENKFQYFSMQIMSCFRNNKCINPDLLIKALRNRLRVISMAQEKINNLDEIINGIAERDHLVVYCGDGRLFYGDNLEEMRHIQAVKAVLTKHKYKASQFTAKENMRDRMELVEAFNKGEISALAAIRCLDEGINIPSIQSALILSSNDDYREFVQRRGRILRTYKDKKIANIYDIIVLPSSNLSTWAKIELRRFYEYAKLAQNWRSIQHQLYSNLETYNLSVDDIDVFDYDEVEDLGNE